MAIKRMITTSNTIPRSSTPYYSAAISVNKGSSAAGSKKPKSFITTLVCWRTLVCISSKLLDQQQEYLGEGRVQYSTSANWYNTSGLLHKQELKSLLVYDEFKNQGRKDKKYSYSIIIWLSSLPTANLPYVPSIKSWTVQFITMSTQFCMQKGYKLFSFAVTLQAAPTAFRVSHNASGNFMLSVEPTTRSSADC